MISCVNAFTFSSWEFPFFHSLISMQLRCEWIQEISCEISLLSLHIIIESPFATFFVMSPRNFIWREKEVDSFTTAFSDYSILWLLYSLTMNLESNWMDSFVVWSLNEETGRRWETVRKLFPAIECNPGKCVLYTQRTTQNTDNKVKFFFSVVSFISLEGLLWMFFTLVVKLLLERSLLSGREANGFQQQLALWRQNSVSQSWGNSNILILCVFQLKGENNIWQQLWKK